MQISKASFYFHLTLVWAFIAMASWPPPTGRREYALTFAAAVIGTVCLVQFVRWLAISLNRPFQI
ncbi:hypothetical protein [Anatilimnocola floriformis]|uniref:hypothetical protein n=1 Tax=Anatilimnocola floriformis TaxID=2948575 RepID=UPI0020C47A6D|nr:hypothetical protein [Anatilimnocola floriformis]